MENVSALYPVQDPQEGTSWSHGVMNLEPTTGIKKRKTEESDSPVDRSRASMFKKFTDIGNQFCVAITTEKEKKKMTAGTFAELIQLKGKFDDLFEAVIEENASLRGKLAEARVKTVTVENRYIPVKPDSSHKSSKPKEQIAEGNLAKTLENLNFDMPAVNNNDMLKKKKSKGKE